MDEARERLEVIMKETGNLFFELGRLHYQVEQDSQEIQTIKTKLHNLRVDAQRIKKSIGTEVPLAEAPKDMVQQ